MREDRLQTKRRTKKGFRMLHVRVKKKQKAATASADALDQDVPNISVSRSLTVILILHLVAIAAIMVGTQWNKGDEVALDSKAGVSAGEDVSTSNKELEHQFVQVGDTYEIFAARYGVDAEELREVNGNAQIYAGRKLALPSRRVEVKQPVVDLARNEAVTERPQIETPVAEQPEAQLVTPRRNPNIPRAVPVEDPGGITHVVKGGDSVWRICRKYGVSQEALLKANDLKDARLLRLGMTLKIPAK